MGENLEADVLIVGAGTAGSYMAWRMASAGHSCLVFERESLEALGTRIGPFHMEEVSFERFRIPPPEGAELLHRITDMTMWSPDLKVGYSFELPTLVMDKPMFIRRLHRYAESAGARLLERASVTGLIIEGGVIRGLGVSTEQGDVEARGRLVIDASGIDGSIRAMMPPNDWLETDTILEEDTIFVYMETWGNVEGETGTGVQSYPYFQGWCAPGPGNTRIVGIGAGSCSEGARKRHATFAKTLPFRGEVLTSTDGRVPYRRPPFSLVDNRLMVLGDAAFMNKPFSGEGVTSGFAACDIALEVAGKALESDDLTREALWPFNVRYFQGQGAKFAFLTAMLPPLMSLSPEEMDYMFSIPGVVTEESSRALQMDYEVRVKPGAAQKALVPLLAGMSKGILGLSSICRLAFAATVAGGIRGLYLRYPERPMDFGPWSRKAEPLWRRADRMKRDYFEETMASLETVG